jgi:hypothetical protein
VSFKDTSGLSPQDALLDAWWLPPGLKIFGEGARMRADGISMMSNDATVEAGMAKANCGASMMGAGASLVGTEAAILVGVAQLGAAPRGGPYGAVREANAGGEVHHMPAWGALSKSQGNPFSYRSAPGILMSKSDHMLTASWGRGADAAAWRAQTTAMLNEGRFLDALARDIADVQAQFPGRYDGEIQQMLDYLWSGNW